MFGACCNFGVVTGCDSHRASTCHVKTKCLNVPKYLYFLWKATFPLNDSKWNKSDHFTFWLEFSDVYFTVNLQFLCKQKKISVLLKFVLCSTFIIFFGPHSFLFTFTCSCTNLETIKIGYNINKKAQLSIDEHSLIEQV